jgi:hypothetical protein
MGKPRSLWLTKVNNGSYYITKTKPIAGRIRGTRKQEMESPFDPLDFRHICEPSISYLLGSTLPPLTPKRIKLTMELIPDGS